MRYPTILLGISIFILNERTRIMAKISKSKLTEHLRRGGLNEGILDTFFRKLKKAKKEREFEKLTNDPEYQSLLKKYNIEPVDWNQTDL